MSYEIYKEIGTVNGHPCESQKMRVDPDEPVIYYFKDGSALKIEPLIPAGTWEEYERRFPDGPLAFKVEIPFEPQRRLVEDWGGGGLRNVWIKKKNDAGEWIEVEGEERERILRERYKKEWVDSYLAYLNMSTEEREAARAEWAEMKAHPPQSGDAPSW
jgi:hypothetical protein